MKMKPECLNCPSQGACMLVEAVIKLDDERIAKQKKKKALE